MTRETSQIFDSDLYRTGHFWPEVAIFSKYLAAWSE
jgi:hypothetical protein